MSYAEHLEQLAGRILEEDEVKLAPALARPAPQGLKGPGLERFDRACRIVEQAFKIAGKGKVALAFSGGSDSYALLALTAEAGFKPTIVWTNTGMEYIETLAFVGQAAKRYRLELKIARPSRLPLDQWRLTGWPFLGKMAARTWTKHHPGAGFRLNVSECCRELKIRPARRLCLNLGATVQLTGQRGQIDDQARGLREHLDGAVVYQKRDKLWIANPLTGWTDNDVAGFSASRRLPEHPAKLRGARTIGCVYCGGGCQFENSGIRILRQTWPAAWRRFIVEWGAGAVILALKYQDTLDDVLGALRNLGGLGKLADERPWAFDFTRRTPLRGYAKGART